MLGLLYQCCPCTKSIACPRFDFAPCLGNFRPQFSPKHTIRIDSIYRIIFAIRKHIATQKTLCIRRSICIRIDEPAVGKVVVPALEVVKARFAVVVIAAVAQGVDVPDEGRIRGLFAVSTMHGVVAPRAVGTAAQRDAAGNDNDLWLCADGCTHHSDHLSIFLRAVLMHRPHSSRINKCTLAIFGIHVCNHNQIVRNTFL